MADTNTIVQRLYVESFKSCLISECKVVKMIGGSYGGCDGYYEETDKFSQPVFIKTDKSRSLAKYDNVWGCYHGSLNSLPMDGGGWYVKSMY